VSAAYEGRHLHFGREYLIPTPFDQRVLIREASAVAQAAMDTGVARKPVDIEEYKHELEARLGPGRELMRSIMEEAKRTPKRIVLPEGEEPVVIRASHSIVEECLGTPVLLGDPDRIRELAEELEIDLEGVEILDPGASDVFEDYAQALFERRMRKGVTIKNARRFMRQPMYYAAMMVDRGDADTLIGGANTSYPNSLRPALQTIDLLPGIEKVASLYMMVFQDRLYFFADTTVNIDPDAEMLADTTEMTADFVRRLGIEPYVAMLSFSNFGSAPHPESSKVKEAVRRVKERRPDISVEGEMQADTAVVKGLLQQSYPFSDLKRPANVLIFPNLAAANAAYKLLSHLGGAEAIGPVLLGLSKPVHITQRGATVAEITNLAAISVVDAEQRRRQGGGESGS
jgi:malate dehydrogenase (oxaloacetate-decarboxylating)(NADP+)